MTIRNLRSIPARDALPRIVADIMLLAGALLLAVSAYLVGWVILWNNYPDPASIQAALSVLYLHNVFTLALVGVVVFALSGFYMRARGYRGLFRALIVFNAVSVTFLVHSFADSFLLRRPLPSGVTLLAWLFSLGLVGGARLFKGYVDHTYEIRRRTVRRERSVENVLVIGGAGYIGSVLVRRLLEAGFRVRVLDSLMFGSAPLASLGSDRRFELLCADFRHVDSVVAAVQGMDAVIHLGAIVGDPACQLDSKMTLETNLAATSMIKQVCRGAGIRRFLFASTCSVYGSSPFLLDERSSPEPVSLYACTKLDAEKILLGAPGSLFAPTILRLGTAFGWSYRPRLDLLVNLLTARALNEGRVTICNRTQWRPFIHIRDIARAFLACLQAPATDVAYQIFNIGSDSLNTTLGDLAEQVAAQIPSVEIEYVRNADPRNYRVSFAKAASELGFTCSRTLEEGIAEMREALASGRVPDYQDARYYNDQTLERLRGRDPRPGAEQLGGASVRFLQERAASAAAG